VRKEGTPPATPIFLPLNYTYIMIQQFFVSAAVIVALFGFTSGNVAAQHSTTNGNTTTKTTTDQATGVRITTKITPLAQDPAPVPLTAAQLEADIIAIEQNLVFMRQSPELVANGSVAKTEAALVSKQNALADLRRRN
jgi:hypothetical protein